MWKHHNTLLPIFPILFLSLLASFCLNSFFFFFSFHCLKICTSQINYYPFGPCLWLCCLEALSYMPSFTFGALHSEQQIPNSRIYMHVHCVLNRAFISREVPYSSFFSHGLVQCLTYSRYSLNRKRMTTE